MSEWQEHSDRLLAEYDPIPVGDHWCDDLSFDDGEEMWPEGEPLIASIAETDIADDISLLLRLA